MLRLNQNFIYRINATKPKMKNPFTRVNQLPIMWVLLSRGMNLHRNYWWVFFFYFYFILNHNDECLKFERLFQCFFPSKSHEFFLIACMLLCFCVFFTRIHAHFICSSFRALLCLSMTVSTNLDTSKIAVHLKSSRWHLRCRNVRNKTRAELIECGDGGPLHLNAWMKQTIGIRRFHTDKQTDRHCLPIHTSLAAYLVAERTKIVRP